MRSYFQEIEAELVEWRRDFHRHPELAFEEHRTSSRVVERLRAMGLDVDHGLAGTGVVGTLRRGDSDRRIGLRADMDALPIVEQTGKDYSSTNPGVMHACGHDGHTTMLLGAARYLAEHGNFDGRVHFIFQPAEEYRGGGRVMIEDGLFERFPCDRVFGMHNFPGFELGTISMRGGAIMAAYDSFDIEVVGRGGHAAFPHRSVDPVVVSAEIVGALQTIVAREIDPLGSAVISVTQLEAGSAYNIIPETAWLRGCTRSLDAGIRQHLETAMTRVARGVAEAHGAEVRMTYERGYPATVNEPEAVERAAAAARRVVGSKKVTTDVAPIMGSEDFSFMLEECPGAYVLLGAGPGPMVHTPRYDFNDAILGIGASYWVELAESELA